MKPFTCTLLASTLALAQAPAPFAPVPQAPNSAPTQTAPGAQEAFKSAIEGVEGMIVGAAEAMPEEKFGYVPTGGEFKDVRTFAQQIKHVAGANFMAGERISGHKPALDVANSLQSMKSKAELLQLLKDSFTFARKAVADIKDADLYTPVPSPFGPDKIPRMLLFLIPVAHSMDHYGQMVIYLRHNGIVPPASRR
jgi:uncharacterized damage-inducible protein DinB